MPVHKKAVLKRIIDVAAGREAADIMITNGKVVDVFNKEVFESDILITEGYIAGFGAKGFPRAKHMVDAAGAYIVPGFIDSHVHIESSHCSPGEFSRLVVPYGTTTVVADPHEICNVCGVDGLDYMIEASKGNSLNIFYMVPSCVPATPFEHAGAIMKAPEIASRINHPQVLGLGELMDFFGVAAADEDILDKLMVAAAVGKPVDGHSPALLGAKLDAYSGSGVRTDHECDTPTELHERIKRGMYVLLREGSACHNVRNLIHGVTSENLRYCLFCTDDRQPKSILAEGHINNNMRIAVEEGLDALDAIRIATINAAECYRFGDRGAIAPGYRADLVFLNDLKEFNAQRVYIGGELVAQDGTYLPEVTTFHSDKVSGAMNIGSFSQESLQLKLNSDKARTIDIIPGGVVTAQGQITVKRDADGNWVHDPEQDVVKLAVVERHHGTNNIGLALLRNYGLRGGAIATSVAHDSHNIIVVGDNDQDMTLAVEELNRLGGGMTVVHNGSVLGSLPLPIAGLMTDQSARDLEAILEEMHAHAITQLHVHTNVDPFMTLCFMALPVIPDIKLTDVGLFDVTEGCFVPVELE